MARTRTVYACVECGAEAPRWQGQCPSCGAWNTLVEEVRGRARGGGREAARHAEPVRLAEVPPAEGARLVSGLAEFDFVLGGGLVPGSVVLVGGEPGIGKSTLLLQVAAALEAQGRRTLYVSAEESPRQIRLRAERLGPDAGAVPVLAETEVEAALAAADLARPQLVVIDSIQTMHLAALAGAPGSVGQVRESAAHLQRWAKRADVAVLLVGHVTKGGSLAGPKTLEHLVDTVLYFEGARGRDHRVLRATKNRFGSVDEIGVFRMTARGLEPEPNPSALFLGDGARGSGVAVVPTIEGTRPLLVEVQALAARTPYGSPQRVSTGFDPRRLALLLAVLERRAGLRFGQLDVFLNVVGGLRIVETGADAAVVAALASSVVDRPLSDDAVFVGEVGLGGELRPVGQMERRLGEAARLGFARAFVPARTRLGGEPPLRIEEVDDVRSLFARLFP